MNKEAIKKKVQEKIKTSQLRETELVEKLKLLESIEIIRGCTLRMGKYNSRDVLIKGIGDNEFPMSTDYLSFFGNFPKEVQQDFIKLIEKWEKLLLKELENDKGD